MKKIAFLALCLVMLMPRLPPGLALLSGIAFALILGNPYAHVTKRWASIGLQVAVVALGFGVDLQMLGRVGLQGAGYTIVTIAFAMGLGLALGKIFKVKSDVSLLISAGTAICGGSAIAAVASTIKAREEDVTVSLATIFLLNAIALFLFPFIGHAVGMTPSNFGYWSALAVHDTSSVVGTATQFGPSALQLGTTVKLTRALWITPLTLCIGFIYNRKGERGKVSVPWFILCFIAASALATALPSYLQEARWISYFGVRLMVVDLFLIGSNLTMATLRALGPKTLLQAVLLWAAVATASFFVVQSSQLSPRRPTGETDTLKMASLLRIAYADEDPQTNFLSNKKRVAYLKKVLPRALTRDKRIWIKAALTWEQLLAGDSADAVAGFQYLLALGPELEAALADFPVFEREPVALRTSLKYWMGVAYLRVGEQANCVGGHNHKSCIFPIKGEGVHMKMEGSVNAARIFEELLRENRYDPRARWLLNVAYMTLGEYPGKVPKEFLIPPKLFESQKDFPEFEDIAVPAGVAVMRGAGAAIMDDFRNKRLFDLVISSPRLEEQLQLFQNNGEKGDKLLFKETTKTSGLLGITDGKNLYQGDFDNDGCLDFVLMRGAYKGNDGMHPFSLVRGHCDGTFEDVTEKAGMMRYEPVYAAAWWDFDNDGWLDLIVPNESGPSYESYRPNKSDDDDYPDRGIELWRNNHNGTFSNVASEAGLGDYSGNYKGVGWADYDHDGRGDLFLSEPEGESKLLRNESKNGVTHFRDVTKEAGLPSPLKGRTVFWFDYDNDGFEDLFVAYGQARDRMLHEDFINSYYGKPVTRHPHVFHNNGNGTFTDATRELGFAQAIAVMGANFGDLDNDGYTDVYLGTGAQAYDLLVPNRMFWNDHGKRFLDATTSAGLGHLQKGHGISMADVDGDGALDIFAQQGGAFEGDEFWSALFHNPGNHNHWLKVKAKGTVSNRSGIGARIKVSFREGGKSRDAYRTVNSGSSRGANPLVQHFGVGKAAIIDRVEVFWPASGKTTVLTNVKPDQWLEIEER